MIALEPVLIPLLQDLNHEEIKQLLSANLQQVSDMRSVIDLGKWAVGSVVGALSVTIVTLWSSYVKSRNHNSTLLGQRVDDCVSALEKRQEILNSVTRIMEKTQEGNEELSKVVAALVDEHKEMKHAADTLNTRISDNISRN